MLGFGKKNRKNRPEDQADPQTTAEDAGPGQEPDAAAAAPDASSDAQAVADQPAGTTAESAAEAEAEQEDTESSAQGPADRAERGPFDVAEVEETSEGYVDLGGLLVPVAEGVSLRLDVEQSRQSVVAVTLTKGEANLQVQAFAAPKSRGLWPEIRTELADSVRSQNGMVDVTEGPFGRQVLAKIPASTPEGRRGFRVARFVGVDGPRWFLRAVFTGDAAIDQQTAQEMEDLFRRIVVVRGAEPMAPRDLLPLRVPADAVRREDAAPQADGQETEGRDEDGVEVPRRGPEITQIG